MGCRFRCYACRTMKQSRAILHEFESDKPECPKCGANNGLVVPLEDVHYLIPCSKGPIEGKSGRRYKIACDPDREVLATSMMDSYAATGEPTAVTCPSCKGVPEYVPHLLYATSKKPLIDPFKGCC